MKTQFGEKICRELDHFHIGSRIPATENFNTHLVKLSLPAGLRTIVTKHGAKIEKLYGLGALMQAVF